MQNREIKFRGLTDGEAPTWVYGCLVNNLWNYSELAKYPKGTPVCEIIVSDSVDDYAELEDKELNVRVIPDSVGQYTGLKDKNGKEIYEGDIVKAGGSMNFSNNVQKDEIRQIAFIESGFNGIRIGEHSEFDRKHPSSMHNWNNYTLWNVQRDLEVIGNIHQNPELLTQ